MPTEKLTFDASYNYRYSEVDNTETTVIPMQKEITTKSLKCSVRYALYYNLTLGTRIDYKISEPAGSRGGLLLQDITYRLRQFPVTVWLRYCIFNTDDWDSRIYIYENDLLNSFSIPALSGKGNRCYIMAEWKISDFAEVRIKYGLTALIESGTSIENKKEFKIQLSIKL